MKTATKKKATAKSTTGKRPKVALAERGAPTPALVSLANINAQIAAFEKRGDIWGMLDLHAKGKAAAEYIAETVKRGVDERDDGKRAQGQMMATVLRIERGLGNLCKRIVDNTPKKKRGRGQDGGPLPTLGDLGISKNESSRWQKLADMPDEVFEDRVQTVIEKCERAAEAAGSARISESKDYESDEYYTPAPYVELVREVFGGEIDLDPASCTRAQETVRATVFYTEAEKGEAGAWKGREWKGRTFLNPPYSDPETFINKLLGHLEAGDIPEAIVLVNNTTDTDWAQKLLAVSAAVCFTRGRIAFNRYNAKEDKLEAAKNTRQGQVFFYLGNDPKGFEAVFGDVGEVLRPRSPLHVPERGAE